MLLKLMLERETKSTSLRATIAYGHVAIIAKFLETFKIKDD